MMADEEIAKVVVTRDNYLIAGRKELKRLRAKGIKKMPVIQIEANWEGADDDTRRRLLHMAYMFDGEFYDGQTQLSKYLPEK
jgi:hypothetical protein